MMNLSSKKIDTANSLKRLSNLKGLEKLSQQKFDYEMNTDGSSHTLQVPKMNKSPEKSSYPNMKTNGFQISINNQITSEGNFDVYSQSDIGSSESIEDFWQSQISKEFHKNSKPQLKIEICEELGLFLTYGSGTEVYFWTLMGDDTKCDWKNSFLYKMSLKRIPKKVQFLRKKSIFGILDCNSSKIDFYCIKFMNEDRNSPIRILRINIKQSFILPEGEFYFVNNFEFQYLSQSPVPNLFLYLTKTKLRHKYEENFLFIYEFHIKTSLKPRKITNEENNKQSLNSNNPSKDTVCIKIPQDVKDFLEIDILRSQELGIPVSKLFQLKEKLEMDIDVGYYLFQVHISKNGKYLCGIVKMTLPDSPHYILHVWNLIDLKPTTQSKSISKYFCNQKESIQNLNSLMEFSNFKFSHSHQGWINHSSQDKKGHDSQLMLSHCLEVKDALIFGDSQGFLFITRKNSYHPLENLQNEKLSLLRQKHLSEKDLKCFSIKKFGRLNSLTHIAGESNKECLEFTNGYSGRIIPLVSGKVTLMSIARKRKKLFVMSDSENCLIQLSIIENNINWDSDFKLLKHISSLNSLCSNFAKLEKQLLQSKLRKELQQMKLAPGEQNIPESNENKKDNFYLSLKRVFGRKAFKSRNNLLAGKKNKIIFNSCSLVCALDITSYRQSSKNPHQGDSLKMGFYGIESLFEATPSNSKSINESGSIIGDISIGTDTR
jgi:hypothetical protein